jgi:hypothetical protein
MTELITWNALLLSNLHESVFQSRPQSSQTNKTETRQKLQHDLTVKHIAQVPGGSARALCHVWTRGMDHRRASGVCITQRARFKAQTSGARSSTQEANARLLCWYLKDAPNNGGHILQARTNSALQARTLSGARSLNLRSQRRAFVLRSERHSIRMVGVFCSLTQVARLMLKF